MPRLIRKTPLIERIKARLDPYDLLLWIAEELNDDAYDEWLKLWATPIGLGLNIIFILARGSSVAGRGRGGNDDVFGDGDAGSGWFAWFVSRREDLACDYSNLTCTVPVRGPNVDPFLFHQRSLCLFPRAKLSPIRAASRHRTRDALSTSCSSGQLACVIITSATPP